MDKNKDSNKQIWKSLEDYENPQVLDEAKKHEFAERVTQHFNPDDLPAISRRKFLALLSASTAFAAASCTDYQDKGEIVPYNNRPEEILPGKADFYASSCNGCETSCGILVKTREGRPIKIDGNPEHPINKGKVCSKGQASILNLYDPERLTGPMMKNRKSSWQVADKNIIVELNKAVEENKEIAIISHSITSPALKELLNDFIKKYPGAKLYSYEEIDNLARLNAWEKVYGSRELPALKWDEANVIFSVEGDFLGTEGDHIENIRKYTSKRDVMKGVDFNRLYVAEGGFSLTGMNADHRIRIKPELQYEFLLALANEIISDGLSNDFAPQAFNEISKYSLSSFASKYEIDEGLLKKTAADLKNNKEKALVYGGDQLSEDSHVVINYINELLNNGDLYDFNSAFIDKGLTAESDWKNFVSNAKAGKVHVCINLDSNPVFHLDNRFGLKEAFDKIPFNISLVESKNETSALANYTLPLNHALESWGNHQVRANVLTLQQPVIAPIFNTRQKEAILLTWINGDEKNYSNELFVNYLKDSVKRNYFDSKNLLVGFGTFWNSALHDGFITLQNEKRNKASASDIKINSPKSFDAGKFSLLLKKSYFVGDGRFLNNGWLQEIPNPVTKVTWDNYAAIAPATAKNLNVKNNDMISISVSGKDISIPVLVQPGLSENTLVCDLGYGRTEVGEVGKNTGFDVDQFIGISGNSSPWIITGVNVSKTGETYKLVSTQEHHSLDDEFVKDMHLKRDIIQGGTLAEYIANPEFMKKEKHEPHDLHDSFKYEGNKWAMSIDLNKCISCGACVSSCNVENNVPVVGKEQVAVGREMQWMRIDRYYSGTPEEPLPSNQPMLCQHCDNAPCENVCPVNATNHSPDGLNQMAYNRCVGTRYCANNCPYKVRRFNFFNFRDNLHDGYYENELTSLGYNPEVTVRSRGVMEKCTFCVQKIMDARSEAIKENRPIKPNEIVTACQQSCPSEAIVFGDANNPESEVTKYINHNLAYHVLEDLNVKPNVTYIAKLRNTQSEDV